MANGLRSWGGKNSGVPGEVPRAKLAVRADFVVQFTERGPASMISCWRAPGSVTSAFLSGCVEG